MAGKVDVYSSHPFAYAHRHLLHGVGADLREVPAGLGMDSKLEDAMTWIFLPLRARNAIRRMAAQKGLVHVGDLYSVTKEEWMLLPQCSITTTNVISEWLNGGDTDETQDAG